MDSYRDGKAEVVEYNGIKFRRYPEAASWADRSYYRPHAGHIRAGMGALHREIWKSVHGEIPDGYHVHHKDGDPLNNDIENLECIPASKHLREHDDSTKSESYLAQRRKFLEKAQPLSVEWHGTEEGRRWHSENAKRMWETWELSVNVCEFCGKEYETPFPERSKYCTPNCRSRQRYADRKDFEERICAHCGEPFQADKHQPNKYCSRSCGAKSRIRTKSGSFQSNG